jgi:hypothetical protein
MGSVVLGQGGRRVSVDSIYSIKYEVTPQSSRIYRKLVKSMPEHETVGVPFKKITVAQLVKKIPCILLNRKVHCVLTDGTLGWQTEPLMLRA